MDRGLAAVAAVLAVLGIVAGVFLLAQRPGAPREVPVPATPEVVATPRTDDPWAYCAAVGQSDRPPAQYLGDGTRLVIQDALARAEGLPQRFADPAARRVAIPWRCMDGVVWACDPGANLPCGPANASREPSEVMRAYCREQQPNGVLPAFVSGHDTIFAWSCRDGAPVIDRQVSEVDARGFVARYWYRLDRPGR